MVSLGPDFFQSQSDYNYIYTLVTFRNLFWQTCLVEKCKDIQSICFLHLSGKKMFKITERKKTNKNKHRKEYNCDYEKGDITLVYLRHSHSVTINQVIVVE